ncbi:L-rhamnose mutarotase [Olivibacter sp. SDN3]|uniref:L-rhamnose mutarotase n=1 Tax=Olivibacter sp. SDN3 TaxID=2764720 RepID=UPI0016510945|nr:L-rhamnose mutarotase [Olivibacter sp. SDN3]QNL52264.1 L-rhamnose mutarotase [Olivibacter sp. SDN3]
MMSMVFSCNAGANYHNAHSPYLVQVVATVAADEMIHRFYELAKESGIEKPLLYQWENHHILYGTKAESERFYKNCLEAYPLYDVQLLEAPFYTFDRKRCQDKESIAVKEYDHVLLSANLVKDSTLQQEYLDYHTQQFEQWPEVSQGFCKAMFQQVLLYRAGRQLFLVISIPKGADFESLDKKTVENNSRGEEWNKLMAKYQEGLPGTSEGEVWVFFNLNK